MAAFLQVGRHNTFDQRTAMKTLLSYLCLSFVSLVCISLSGCKYSNTSKRANEIMVSGWVGPGTCPTTATPTYCYSTLARVECYSEPQPGMEHRLVGFYDPRAAKPVCSMPHLNASAPKEPLHLTKNLQEKYPKAIPCPAFEKPKKPSKKAKKKGYSNSRIKKL